MRLWIASSLPFLLGLVVIGCGDTGNTSATSSGASSGGAGSDGAGGAATGTGGSMAGSGGAMAGTGGAMAGSGGAGGAMAGSGGAMAGTGGAMAGSGGVGGAMAGSGGAMAGTGGAMAGSGGAGGGVPPFCTPGATEPCYTGPAGTAGVGICGAGARTCLADGSAFGPCTGEVLPMPEACSTPEDDDCDGQTNEEGLDCICVPNSVLPCYSGPMGTEGVGVCKAGLSMCNTLGTALGPCMGEVTPSMEICATPEDDDCNGMANESGPDCVCTPNTTTACYSGPAGTEGVGICKAGSATCNALGTTLGSCVGEVLPVTETCLTPADDDCDGQTNESGAGCVCLPNTTTSCYTGPAGTQGVGACKAGTATCNAQGTALGPCTGQVTPLPETCMTPVDDNCNGQVNEGCAAQICGIYTESFDDGKADPLTSGVYKIDWCDTYIPQSFNTPLCMSGQTLRTNDSTIDPTIWVYKGDASCTSVKMTYTYYQFALAGVQVQYSQSNDAAQVCEKFGSFTTLASPTSTQQCVTQSLTIPFGSSKGVYIRFEHGSGTNAIWIDNLSLELSGCGCQ